MKMPTVALVGSPNVGKSTIFNRLVGRKVAIIEDVPGITRDRIYGIGSYDDYKFNLIDTGGIDTSNETFNIDIKMQAEIAIDEADVVIFVVDGKMGLNANDFVVRDILFKSKKKVIVAINKIDNRKHLDNLYDFYELGFEHYIPISGEHAIGFDDLMDEVTKGFPKYEEEYSSDVLKFCLIGRPNVGKSTLLNCLVNAHVAITSNKPQTTRNIIQGVYNEKDLQIVFVDTPGIHKPIHKLGKTLNKQAISLSKDVDVILFLADASEYLGNGDKYVMNMLKSTDIPVILVLNKIDKLSNEQILLKIKEYKDEYPFAEIVPVSALKNDNTNRLLEVIKKYLTDDMKYFEDDYLTSNSLSFMVSEFVREKILNLTEEEVPHSITCLTTEFEEKENIVNIAVDIIVDRASLKKIIIGSQGSMLKQIGTLARKDIEALLNKKVYLELFVKVIPNWRDKERYIKELGFKDFE